VEFLFQAHEHKEKMLGGSMIFPISNLKQVFDVGIKIQEGDGRAALVVVVALSPVDQKVCSLSSSRRNLKSILNQSLKAAFLTIR